MMLKKIYLVIVFLFLSLLIILIPKIVKAAYMDIGSLSGPPGLSVVIRGQDFCIHNAGTAINIFWNDHLIHTATSPMFSFTYTIPNASPGTYPITGIAGCPGIPPSIPAYPDYGATSFTVTSSGSSPAASPTSGSGSGVSISPGASSSLDPSASASISASASASAAAEEAKQNEQKKLNPWYKNWKYIAPLSILFLALIAGIIFVIVFERHKHKKKKELEKVMPRIHKEGKK